MALNWDVPGQRLLAGVQHHRQSPQLLSLSGYIDITVAFFQAYPESQTGLLRKLQGQDGAPLAIELQLRQTPELCLQHHYGVGFRGLID